jgi:circadian clock protein KaiB
MICALSAVQLSILQTACSTVPTPSPSTDYRAPRPTFWLAGAVECKRGGLLGNKYLLKLYVTGTSPRTSTAISNLQRICEQELEGRYELEIIDVLEYPQLAEDEKILATPTLIKQLPPPLRRVIGDLSDKEKVLFGLEVRPELRNTNPAPDAS